MKYEFTTEQIEILSKSGYEFETCSIISIKDSPLYDVDISPSGVRCGVRLQGEYLQVVVPAGFPLLVREVRPAGGWLGSLTRIGSARPSALYRHIDQRGWVLNLDNPEAWRCQELFPLDNGLNTEYDTLDTTSVQI